MADERCEGVKYCETCGEGCPENEEQWFKYVDWIMAQSKDNKYMFYYLKAISEKLRENKDFFEWVEDTYGRILCDNSSKLSAEVRASITRGTKDAKKFSLKDLDSFNMRLEGVQKNEKGEIVDADIKSISINKEQLKNLTDKA